MRVIAAIAEPALIAQILKHRDAHDDGKGEAPAGGACKRQSKCAVICRNWVLSQEPPFYFCRPQITDPEHGGDVALMDPRSHIPTLLDLLLCGR